MAVAIGCILCTYVPQQYNTIHLNNNNTKAEKESDTQGIQKLK